MNTAQNRLRIAVCDDDTVDREEIVSIIAKYIDEHDYFAMIDEFSSAEDFLAAGTDAYGIVFLDIFMDGVNGMDAARLMFKDNKRTKIVFCSSSAEFGVESYDVRAIRYLVKPVAEDRIFEILDYFFYVYTALRTLTVKVGRTEETIYINDILWIESDKHNCIIHTRSGDTVTRATFDQLREQLPEGEFVQPIRYALANLRAVTALPSKELMLEGDLVIPIVKESREAVKKAYIDYSWKKMYE